MAREVRVAILGDSRDFSRAVSSANRDAGRLQGTFTKTGGAFAGLAKTAAIGAAGLAVGAVALGKGFVDAAVESQKVTKQTEAVIKSMGGASKVTAKQVADLSTKLSLKSGVDDELIQSGSNLLLTFGNVRNEVGKGNDIFNRANAAALDMSVAMGTDMKSSAMQVGKALNDPIKGLSKLTRSGVQFTDQQEKQIKAMVKAGDTAGAQKIMLKELERQFGGSAAAQATAGDKLKVAWGNLQEQLGAKLLPVVEKVASFLADKLPGAFEAAGRVIGPIAKQVSMFWNTLTSGFTEDEGTPIERFALKVREFVPKVIAGFQQVVGFVQQNWPTIQRIISQVAATIQTVIAGAVAVITVLWQNFGNNILSFVQRVWPPIQQIISGAMQIIRGVIQVVTSIIQGDWANVWNGIKAIFSGVWTAIQGIVKTALEGIRLVIGAALEVAGSMIKSAWNGIVDFFKKIPGRLASAAGGMFNFVKDSFRTAINAVIGMWNRFKVPSMTVGGEDPLGVFGPSIPKVKIGGWELPNIPTMAQGGRIPGALNQPRLLLAHGGEHLSQASAKNRTDRRGGGDTIVIQVGDREVARLYADGKVRAERRGVAV